MPMQSYMSTCPHVHTRCVHIARKADVRQLEDVHRADVRQLGTTVVPAMFVVGGRMVRALEDNVKARIKGGPHSSII